MTMPNHISALRAELLATLVDLRSRTNPMEPDRAKAIAQVGGVLVDSARAEIEFLRVTGGDSSVFLQDTVPRLSQPEPGRTVHRLS